MARSHSWIFQATPRSRDLVAELRASDSLEWSVSRHGRDLQPGDRVYYWQAGRDAGVYGVGAVRETSTRGPDGKYAVRTVHERALFAPITRAELRDDEELRSLAVLRQPRGTVFPLTAAQDIALGRRAGVAALTLALPAGRLVAGKVRLRPREDAEPAARVAEAWARGDEIVVVTVSASIDDGGDTTPAPEGMRVISVRTRRDGGTMLRVEALPDAVAPPLPDEARAQVAAGRAIIVPPTLPPTLPSSISGQSDPETTPRGPVALPIDDSRGGASRVAEGRGEYGSRAPSMPRAPSEPFAPSTAEVYGGLVLPPEIAPQLVAAINSGRHVVLMGLPGVGKTSLALNLARAAVRAGWCDEPLLATATADWTTFDTIGGLTPGPDGALRFSPGVALRALRDNRWLILDELNRADIDKAFGPLLTVLAGAAVELPTVDATGRPIRVEPAPGPAGLLDDGVTYRAGTDWRIVATMNTLDRAALFAFSLAFARRFAFVLTPPPAPDAALDLVRARAAPGAAALAVLRRALEVTPRPLGPAVLLDAARYIAARGEPAALAEALGLFVLPQLEGLAPTDLILFAGSLAPLLGPDGDRVLRGYIAAFNGEG